MTKCIKKFQQEDSFEIIVPSPLNKALSTLMKLKSIDDRALAKATGLGHTNIVRMRNDPKVNPTISTLMPIAEFFNISIDQLITNNINKTELINTIDLENIENWFGNILNNINTIFSFSIYTDEYTPFFPKNSKFFVDPTKPFQHNNLVLVKLKKHLSICRLIKSPDGYFFKDLKSINRHSAQLLPEHKVFGVIVEITFL